MSQIMKEADEEDGWLVPHGYLSDDEGLLEESEQPTPRPKVEQPKRKQLETLVPILIAPCYNNVLYDFSPYTIQILSGGIGIDPFQIEVVEVKKATKSKTPSKTLPDELVDELKSMIEGKDCGIAKIVEEFKEKHTALSKATIENKIKQIAIRERRPTATSVLFALILESQVVSQRWKRNWNKH